MFARSAVIILLLLAGCTQNAPTADVDASLGTVAGVTVTSNIEPIAGALVDLGPGGRVETDLFGRFRVDGLPPGSYRLVASAEGHEDAIVTVDVQAGQTARPRIVLPAVAMVLPHRETVALQGYFPAGFGAADDALHPAKQMVFGDCTCHFVVPTGPRTVAVVVEAVWSDNLERPDQPTRMRWEARLANTTLQGDEATPLRVVLAEDFGEGFLLSLLPDDTWVVYDQSFQVFITRWDVARPPEGWSRVRGDA